jgi:hypothetical protein
VALRGGIIRQSWKQPVLSVNACSIRRDVKNILLPPPEARLWFAASSPWSDRSDARVLCLALWFRVLLCSISAAACSLVATTPIALLKGRVRALGARGGRSRLHWLGACDWRGGWATIVLAFVWSGGGLDWFGGAHDQRFCGRRAGALAAVAQGSGCYRYP